MLNGSSVSPSVVEVVLGKTGLDYVVLINEGDGNDERQSYHWDSDHVGGIPKPLIKIFERIKNYTGIYK